MSGIRFLLDGQIVCAENVSRTTTVLEYLRETLHRTGTKEGCAEGDCGACTVVLGEPAADGSRIDYRAVNSCIRFLPTIDGQELVTVESLLGSDGALHPVQQSMVDHHGSQCGFCTPGFVMSLFALYLQNGAPSRGQVVDSLCGNLCRCTGYRPIIDAGLRMGEYPPAPHWNRDTPLLASRLESLRALKRTESMRIPGFYAPHTVDELATELENNPGALVLAGGTDVGLWVTKQLRELPAIVYVGSVAELKSIQRDGDALSIGAAVSLTESWRALVAEYPTLAEMAQRFASPPVCNSGTLCGNLANGSPIGDSLPVLIALNAELELRKGARTRRLALERFYLGYQRTALEPGEFVVAVRVPVCGSVSATPVGAVPVKRSELGPAVGSAPGLAVGSTPGLATGSAAGLTVGSAQGSTRGLAVGSAQGPTPRPAAESAQGPAVGSAMATGSAAANAGWVAAYKVSKRIDQDISAVAAAFAIRVDDGRVVSARIAFGGMAAVAARAAATERALLGASWTRASVEAAAEKLAEDFTPLTDMRASSAYRLRAAANLLRRFYFEHGGATDPTRTVAMSAVSV